MAVFGRTVIFHNGTEQVLHEGMLSDYVSFLCLKGIAVKVGGNHTTLTGVSDNRQTYSITHLSESAVYSLKTLILSEQHTMGSIPVSSRDACMAAPYPISDSALRSGRRRQTVTRLLVVAKTVSQ